MKSITIFLSLMACLCCASALMCFVCNSLSDKGCDSEVVSKDYLIDCKYGRNSSGPNTFKPEPNAKVCWKQRQDVEGMIIVDRMCGAELEKKSGNTCYDRVGTKKVKVRYCVCSSDKCNGSGSVAASSMAVVLGLLVTYLARP